MAALLVSLVAPGCVQRRMTIRTNPPGALVYVDDYYIGTTPVSTDFVYYGRRKIRVIKDGYETLTIPEYPIQPPFYEVFPLDFIAENIVPWEIRDERYVDLQLQPQVIVPQDQLLARAEELRSHTRGAAGIVPGLPSTTPMLPGGAPVEILPGPTTPAPGAGLFNPPPVLPGPGSIYTPPQQPLPPPSRY